VHDFMLAPKHVVFYLSPHILDVEVLMQQGKSVMDALSWRPERGSRLLVVSRSNGKRVAEIEIGSGATARYCLHLANAWQADDASGAPRLVLDVIELDRPVYDQYQVIPELFLDEPQGRLVRFVIDPASWRVVARHEHPYAASMDFPAIDPRRAQTPTRHTWVLSMSASGRPGRKFFDQVARIDTNPDLDAGLTAGLDADHELWTAPAGTYLGGEPVFLPDPRATADHGAGCVLCQSLDTTTGRGAFLLFDGHRLARGPIATLHLEHPIPLCFHASFHASSQAGAHPT
jgi:carotenoid cleavage dioxygenase-like enzyme